MESLKSRLDYFADYFSKMTFIFVPDKTITMKFGFSCSKDSLVIAESFVLRINNCGKNPAPRKSPKR